ncbi:MAG: hypothetical protein OHK0038_10660 [Flammeovirgaceae bacterium]
MLGLVFSCEETGSREDNTLSPITQNASNERVSGENIKIKSKGRYLEFANMDEFRAKVEEMRDKEWADIQAFEQELGFTSLRTVYEQATLEDIKFMEALEKSNKKPNTLQKGLKSNYAKNYAHAFLVEEEYFWMNIFDYALANVINHEGLVKIGNALFQYTEGTIKWIEDGAEIKIELMKSLKASNETSKIFVSPVKKVEVGTNNTNAGERTSYSGSCTDNFEDKDNKRRIVTTVNLYEYNWTYWERYCEDEYEAGYGDYSSCYDRIVYVPAMSYTCHLKHQRDKLIGGWGDTHYGNVEIRTVYRYGSFPDQTKTYTSTSNNVNHYLTVYQGTPVDFTKGQNRFRVAVPPTQDCDDPETITSCSQTGNNWYVKRTKCYTHEWEQTTERTYSCQFNVLLDTKVNPKKYFDFEAVCEYGF